MTDAATARIASARIYDPFAFAENRCRCGAPATTLTIGGRRCRSCAKRLPSMEAEERKTSS